MIENVLPNIYRIEIPLPHNPLRSLNSYFIKGRERNLLIDTGFNQPECRAAMDEARQEIGFSMDNTDIFITHIHSDHAGLVHYLAAPSTVVFCDAYTANAFKGPQLDYWNYFNGLITQSGLRGVSYTDHPGYKYKTEKIDNIHLVIEGDVLVVGDFHLQCLSTPGHAPDHTCLYDPQRRILFSGDHILDTITPNNTLWEQPATATRDLLQEYIESLDKIAALDIELTLPAHRQLIKDCNQRIRELKEHHHKRLEDILNILGDSEITGAEVASQMRWDMRNQPWEEFSAAQKIFATGEALSHLTHLVLQKVLVRDCRDGVVYYSRDLITE